MKTAWPIRDDKRGSLCYLQSRPACYAILVEWASELPALFQVDVLPEYHRPKLDGSDFLAAWSGRGSDGETVERIEGMKTIVYDWQKISAQAKKNN